MRDRAESSSFSSSSSSSSSHRHTRLREKMMTLKENARTIGDLPGLRVSDIAGVQKVECQVQRT